VENVNGLIQAAKARARGYRNIENLVTMTFLTGGRMKGLLENPMITRLATPICSCRHTHTIRERAAKSR